MNKSTSRFFNTDDHRIDKLIFDLPVTWWSRPYEYAWASEFAEAHDIALDAASGICHPFKFYLSDHCQEVYACDIDDRITSPLKILEEVTDIFGQEAANTLPERYLKQICYSKASLVNLPYKNNTFNKIYCISVIEHLDDCLNKYPILNKLGLANKLCKRDIYYVLREFKRVLSDDGLVILTMDYPTININYLCKILEEVGLEFLMGADLDIPKNAIYSVENNLYCFRAVLKKKVF